jgi:hypothetical protein
MTNKIQWTMAITAAVLAGTGLLFLGALIGWAFAGPPASSWTWPFQMGSWMGPGMMGSAAGCYGLPGSSPDSDQSSLGLAGAGQAVEEYLQSLDRPDLAVAEVMEFSNHFYAEVAEQNSGVHAMELLIDKDSGAVYPEYGPNMMWNTKYGMHSGSGWSRMMGDMMSGFAVQEPSAEMPVSAEQAVEYARRYLDTHTRGKEPADEADRFYGYYTIHTLSDGQIDGMLSINGYTGELWYHDWHGQFVDMLHSHES